MSPNLFSNRWAMSWWLFKITLGVWGLPHEIIFVISIKMTTYYPHKITLSDGQKVSLARAFGPGEAVTLRFKNEALAGGSDTLHLTTRQIKKIQRAIKNKTGVDIDMSKTQIRHVRSATKLLPTGAGMRVKQPPTGGKGMRINPPPYMRPPPFIGSWRDQKKAYLR